jgi:C2 domain
MRLELSLYAHRLQNVAGIFQGQCVSASHIAAAGRGRSDRSFSLTSVRLSVSTCGKGTSDPYAVVTSNPTDGTPAVVLGETEVIRNTLSPEWATTIRLPDYEMGSPTRLAVTIYDHNSNNSNNHKSMGCVVFDVSDILAAKGHVMGKRLTNDRGAVYATVRPLPEDAAGVLRLTLQCRNLPNVETGGGMWRRDKSDPFLVLSRPMMTNEQEGGADDAGHAWDSVFRSAVREGEEKQNSHVLMWL